MNRNEYDSAAVVEIGAAVSVILGQKTNDFDLDSAGVEPMDRHYEESAFTNE